MLINAYPVDLVKGVLDYPWAATFLLKAIRDEKNTVIDFQWVYINNKAYKMFSPLPLQPGNRISESFPDNYFQPEAPFFDAYVKVVETGEPLEQELFYKRGKKDTWVCERITPFEDGVLVMREDITQYKIQEENLKAHESLLQSVLDNTTHVITVFDPVRNEDNHIVDFKFVLLNKLAAQRFSHLASEMEGKLLSEYFTGIFETDMFQRYVHLAETGEGYDIELHYNHNGLEGWFREIGVWMQGRIMFITEDITERKQKEATLKKNKELLLESQEIAQLGSFQWNKEMTEAIWTRQLYKIYAIEPNSIKINLDFIASIIHLEDKERFFAEVNPVIKNKKGSYSVEYRAFTKEGIMKHMWARGRMVNGMLTGTVMDITQRKELELKNTKLASRNDELDNFVYTASHDLRSPVNNIEMLVGFLSRDYKNGQQKVEMYLDLLKKSTTHLKNTLQDLNTVTEIHQEEQKDLVNLNELIEDLKVALYKEIEDASAVIHTNLDIPFLEIPKKHARSLLFNLLSNAIKFRAKDRTLIVQISSTMQEGKIRLIFIDNGMGIREADQAKVFKIFKRFNPEITGRGIGMFLVKRIIDLNNGTIYLESKENVGTTFHVEFPNFRY